MNYLREIKKALLLGVIIFIVLQVINLVLNQSLPSIENIKWNFLYTMLYAVVLYMANALIFIQLDKYFERIGFI
ncbi:MAG: hypothetical protein HC854_15270 [Flavobacterium sp.]|nr:hypothetical protein [Flavobacterium sp.]